MQKLFDSIVKGYPIGSLLLWTREAPAQRIQLGALAIDAPSLGEAFWVVDGQQRLTTLANTLHADGYEDPRFAIAYNLVTEEFVRRPAAEDPMIIPLPIIFDLEKLLQWFAQWPGIGEYIPRATAVTRRIRQFEVPAYLVTSNDQTVLQDIFDRMNNYGKRLSRAEIFSALNAGSEDVNADELTFDRISEGIDDSTSFGSIDDETVLAAILARRGPEVRRDIRSEFSHENDEGRDAAYEAGERALKLAVNFLQGDAGVPHISFLAYRYLLVVLARVFAFYPDLDDRNRQLLRRWYWQAAAVGPEVVRGSTPNAARILCARVTKESASASIQGLLQAVKSGPRAPDLSRFATNEAATKMILCAWWERSPRSPVHGEPYSQTELAHVLGEQLTARDVVRYIAPQRLVPREARSWAANRAILLDSEVGPRQMSGLLRQQPLTLQESQWLAVLESHAITPEMASLAAAERWSEVISARQLLLQDRLQNFLARMCEWNFENTPPLSVYVLDEDEEDLGTEPSGVLDDE